MSVTAGWDTSGGRTPEERDRAAAERAARRRSRSSGTRSGLSAASPAAHVRRVAQADEQLPAPQKPSGVTAGQSGDRETAPRTQEPLAAPQNDHDLTMPHNGGEFMAARADDPGSATQTSAHPPPQMSRQPNRKGNETRAAAAKPASAQSRPAREAAAAGDEPVAAAVPRYQPPRSNRAGAPRERRTRIAGSPRSPERSARWGLRLLVLGALLAIGFALFLINKTFQPFHGEGEGAVRVSVPEGAAVGEIGAVLADRGVVDSATFFQANVTLTGRRARLRAGDYTLRRDMSYGDASEALMQGPKVKIVKKFNVTIPEGLSRREIAGVVSDSAIAGKYLKATSSQKLLARARGLGLPRSGDTLEGFLFPATYEMLAGADARDLANKQLDAYEQNFSQIDMSRAKRGNLTRYDVLIIASMVEREVAIDRERPLVAAVIYNRLREGIPLGIDATIRYATNNWQRPILQSELEADGPYNSRLRQGLPPTPIGNPGLASLQAAAKPAKVDYLYYVVKPGTCGEHAFSSSDAQFQRDTARYNAEREAAGGKSPTTC